MANRGGRIKEHILIDHSASNDIIAKLNRSEEKYGRR